MMAKRGLEMRPRHQCICAVCRRTDCDVKGSPLIEIMVVVQLSKGFVPRSYSRSTHMLYITPDLDNASKGVL